MRGADLMGFRVKHGSWRGQRRFTVNVVSGPWRRCRPLALLVALALPEAALAAEANPAEADVSDGVAHAVDRVGSYQEPAIAMAQDIWEFAELGYQEERSSGRLADFLAGRGFAVERGVADMPTAFVASRGTGSPVIGILAEFDALPGLSQAARPERAPRAADGAGHACGHHLFGSASVTAAAALADWLAAAERSGEVRVYGTPAEEGGSGKVYMTRAGLFDDVDIVLHWHPSDRNDASASSSTANKSARFSFHGKAAHAASAPAQGRSALDGVEAMNFMVNLMREHVPSDARIHYVITDGGAAPNIVPETAQVYYYVRHPRVDVAQAVFQRIVAAAEAAALGTGTTVSHEVMHGNYPLLRNDALAQLIDEHLRALGGIAYTPAERSFADAIRKTLVAPRMMPGSEADVQPLQFKQGMGSTDVGDVSWHVPTGGFRTATWPPGTPAHSWQAVAAGGMSIGHKGMMLAARTLAATGVALVLEPRRIKEARAEFERRRGADFVYAPLLGDRAPPLDYRR